MSDTVVILYPELVPLCGGCRVTAQVLAQFIHLQKLVNANKGGCSGGFLKSFRDWLQEAAISRYYVEKSRKILNQLGLLQFQTISAPASEKSLRAIYGCSPVTHYKLNIEKVIEFLQKNNLTHLTEKLGLKIQQTVEQTVEKVKTLIKSPLKSPELTPQQLKALAWAKTHDFWKDKITENNIIKNFEPEKEFYKQYYKNSHASAPSSTSSPIFDKEKQEKQTAINNCDLCNEDGFMTVVLDSGESFHSRCHHHLNNLLPGVHHVPLRSDVLARKRATRSINPTCQSATVLKELRPPCTE